MSNYIELFNEDNVSIGKIEFLDGTGYEESDDSYCFYGIFTRLEKAKYSDDILETDDIVFELWIQGNNIEWGEGVNTREKHLNPLEQALIIKDLKNYKDHF